MEDSKLTHVIKNVLFGSIVCLMLVPLIQTKVNYFEVQPLNGSFATQDFPKFSIENWFNGIYQEEKQTYLNENFGFRPAFVRFYNQSYYSVFNIARANSVIIGKEDYLYEENYILAHLGRNFIGHSEISKTVDKIEVVSNALRKKGIDLVIVFAPGKGSFYPEYIPDEYNPSKITTTNYEVYCKKLARSDIHFLDFNAWFRTMKSSSPYPLYPKTGIHWSKYGEVLAADSMIKYINSVHPQKQIAGLKIGTIETSNVVRDTDDDIEKGMNLMFNISDLTMAYPHFEVLKNSKNPPTIMTVADSYYWGIFNWGLSRDAFNNGQFWFYNELIYPESFEKEMHSKDIDIQREVEKNDVVIILTTDANLHKFPFGFIDRLYEVYKEK